MLLKPESADFHGTGYSHSSPAPFKIIILRLRASPTLSLLSMKFKTLTQILYFIFKIYHHRLCSKEDRKIVSDDYS